MSLIVFFYCYGDHRDLHSFPTRRSSDLCAPRSTSTTSPRRRSSPTAPSSPPPSTARSATRPTPRDRKSTRLNSSHSQISYAVFCLKKKNYIHNPHVYGGQCNKIMTAGCN